MAINFPAKDYTDNDTTVPISGTNMDLIWAAVKVLSDFLDAKGTNLSSWGDIGVPYNFGKTSVGIVTTDANVLTGYPIGSSFTMGAVAPNCPAPWGLLVNIGKRYDGYTYQQYILDNGLHVYYRIANTSGGTWVER
jgi:hypothetical protein